MVKPEDIGKGNRLRFKNDKALYYSKNVDSSKKYVYVNKGDDTSRDYKKAISDIIQIDNKKLSEDLFRKAINEEYDSASGMLFGYHITSEKYAEDIKKNGLKTGTRSMQGGGLYAFYDYSHAMRYLKKGEVNNPVIVKFNILNPRAFLYLNMDIAKQVLGDDYHLVDQCESYFYNGIEGLLEEVNKTGINITRDELIEKLNKIESNNTESSQRTFCFHLIPKTLNDRLNIVWNGNYGLEYRINRLSTVNIISITRIDPNTGKELEYSQVSQLDRIPDTEKFAPLKKYMIDNNLDDIGKASQLINKKYMEVRNNREFEYYTSLGDLIDELPSGRQLSETVLRMQKLAGLI